MKLFNSACILSLLLLSNAVHAEDAKPTTEAAAAPAAAPAAATPTTETPATPAPATPATPEVAKKSEEAPPSWYFGIYTAAGIPHFMTYGLDAVMPNGYISFGLSAGSFENKSGKNSFGIKTQDLTVRLHPFSGSFYLGAAFGNQTLYAASTESIASQDVSLRINIKSSYMIPHIGWMWGIKDGGFFFSSELGLQQPSSVKTDLVTNAPALLQTTDDYKKLESDVKESGDKIGKVALPFITLIKLGWLF